MADTSRKSVPGDTAPADLDLWKKNLTQIGEKKGWFQQLGQHHKALFIRQSSTLVVTFDNLDDSRQDSERLPWGVDFITSQGWSSLGLMAHGSTWYRDVDVLEFFDRLKREKFFDQFDRVVFYGTSMGGYAACAFSAVVPGSTVIAVNPQATLDRDITPWERRFRPAWRYNYKGKYGYAPEMVKSAEHVYLFYDSVIAVDSMHAALFQGDNITKIRCAHMGHGILSIWRDMGVLKDISAGCINGTLDTVGIYKLLRNRRNSIRYQKRLLQFLVGHRLHVHTVLFCNAILRRRPGPHFRNAMREARAALKAQGRWRDEWNL